MSLPELSFDAKKFEGKITLLFGETGTGKSSVMLNIMKVLCGIIDQVIIFSPMDKQNNTFGCGIVPTPCIHYEVSENCLLEIWERQQALIQIYTKASKRDTILRLFNMIPNNQDAIGIINNIENKRREHITEIKNSYADEDTISSKIGAMETDCNELIMKIYRHRISQSSRILEKMKLTDDERWTLKYIDLNPKLLLIFDDCTDILKKIKTNPVIQKLFYQGRHVGITCLIGLHTDKALDAELRKNAFVTVFTSEPAALAYFDRGSNDFDKDMKARAKNALKVAFTPLAKYQKLVWIRDERKFYRCTATRFGIFRFGSKALWDFCDKIKSDPNVLSQNNKYLINLMQ